MLLIAKDTFEDEFSNGYLLGEILSKHGLQVSRSLFVQTVFEICTLIPQDDFSSFSKGK